MALLKHDGLDNADEDADAEDLALDAFRQYTPPMHSTWSAGMLECWSIGVLDSAAGVLECWSP